MRLRVSLTGDRRLVRTTGPESSATRYGLAERTVFSHHRAEWSDTNGTPFLRAEKFTGFRRTWGRSERRPPGIVQPTTSNEMDAVMDFAFSETQQHWYDAATRFAREELADPEAASREKRGEFWCEGYQRCARFGILGLPVPVEYGGRGLDLATTVAAVEGLGLGCADTGLIFGTGASIWTVTMPMLAFGTEAQKKALPARPVRWPAAWGQRRQRARRGFGYLRHGGPRRPAR